MDHYHTWFDLKPGVKDMDFARNMDHLKDNKLIEGWRLTRRKLGFAPPEWGEFHIVMETKGLAQLDAGFNHVSARREPVESVHFGINAHVQNLKIALYRDFPDAHRHEGAEKF